MKLKKVVEKAKQQRMEAKREQAEDALLTEKTDDFDSDKNTCAPEWSPPVY